MKSVLPRGSGWVSFRIRAHRDWRSVPPRGGWVRSIRAHRIEQYHLAVAGGSLSACQIIVERSQSSLAMSGGFTRQSQASHFLARRVRNQSLSRRFVRSIVFFYYLYQPTD